ncbi:hypothetical protein C8F01DRAFT_1082891 [Mycena amicta]|nr:hypothetical protein C8F01DRAFT_1082891 [Mycena amicta]
MTDDWHSDLQYLFRSPGDSGSDTEFRPSQADEIDRNFRRRERKLACQPYTPRSTATRTKGKIHELYNSGILNSQISSQDYIEGLCKGILYVPVASPVPPSSPLRVKTESLDPFIIETTSPSAEILALREENERLKLEMEGQAVKYFTSLEQLTNELEGCRNQLRKWAEFADMARRFFGDARDSFSRFLSSLDDTQANKYRNWRTSITRSPASPFATTTSSMLRQGSQQALCPKELLYSQMENLSRPLTRQIAVAQQRCLGWRRHVIRGKTFAFRRRTNFWAFSIGFLGLLLSFLCAVLVPQIDNTLSWIDTGLIPLELFSLLGVLMKCCWSEEHLAVQFIDRRAPRQKLSAQAIAISIQGPFPRFLPLTNLPPDISSQNTIWDVVSELYRRRAVADLSKIGFTITCGLRTLSMDETLEEAGVGNHLTLDLRLFRLGGAARNERQSSRSTGFSGRGRFRSAHPKLWIPAGGGRYKCTICEDSNPTESHNVPSHEASCKHHKNLENWRKGQAEMEMEMLDEPSREEQPSGVSESASGVQRHVRRMLSGILQQMLAPQTEQDMWVDEQTGVSTWSSEFAAMDATMDNPLTQEMAFLAAKLDEYLNAPPSDINSDDQLEERSDPDKSDSGQPHPPLERNPVGRGRHAIDLSNTDNEWFPWPDRETCVLDILRHVPRCAFSRTQNTAIHWAMNALGLRDLPSDRVMDDVDKILQPLCGIQSIRYSGKLGHIYYVNDLAAIIAQVSNGVTRAHS